MHAVKSLIPLDRFTQRITTASIAYQGILAILCIGFVLFNQQDFTIEKLAAVFGNWDARAYIYLSQNGYQSSGDEANFIAFYPLYPLLIRIANLIIPSPHISALLISCISSAIGHIVFFLYLWDIGFEEKKIWRVAILVFLSPIAVFFCMAYTESLFFAETALFLYLLHHRRYNLCVIVGVLASATRLFGVLFIIPYVIHFIADHRWKHSWRHLLKGMFIPAGFLSYLCLNYFIFSDFFHFLIVQKQNWHKESVNPLIRYWHEGKNLLNGRLNSLIVMEVDRISTLLVAPLIFLYSFLVRKSLRAITIWQWLLWSLAQYYIIVSQSFWLSNTRYIFAILPIYIFIEEVCSRSMVLFVPTCIFTASLAFYGIHVFSTGHWLY